MFVLQPSSCGLKRKSCGDTYMNTRTRTRKTVRTHTTPRTQTKITDTLTHKERTHGHTNTNNSGPQIGTDTKEITTTYTDRGRQNTLFYGHVGIPSSDFGSKNNCKTVQVNFDNHCFYRQIKHAMHIKNSTRNH